MLQFKLRVLRILVGSLLAIFLLAYLLIQLPSVQTKLSQVLANSFSKNIGAEVKIGHVELSIFNKLDMKEVLIRDLQKDTLLYTQSLKLRISDLFFSNNEPVLKYIGLEKTRIYLHRKTAQWNYQFLVNYFATNSNSKTKRPLQIKKIDIADLIFIKKDEWEGNKMELWTGNILVNIKSIDTRKIVIDKIVANKPHYILQSFSPIHPKTIHVDIKENGNYFNPNHLTLFINECKIANGLFWIEDGFSKPNAYFDGGHIRMNHLNANISDISLQEDTIKATASLSLKERSGFEIKSLHTQFTMTPQLMEFSKLLLKTNNSTVGPYYAMQYSNMGKDFSDYIQKVTMKAHLVNAVIHTDDIAYFAPAMGHLHQKINTSFHFSGTVDNFEAKDLLAAYQGSFVKGSFSMQGIPYMRKTLIKFTNVNAKTNFTDLSSWLPSIQNIKQFPFKTLGDISFKGDFSGTLFDFITKGSLSTQMGMATTEIRLQFPEKGEPSYEGQLNTYQFNAGKLFNIQELGLLNFTGKIAGSSFALDKIKTNIEGAIDSIQFHNYTYTNINTKGLFQKGFFDGSLQIKDSNLIFNSNVQIDLRGSKPRIIATGNLGKSNLQSLHFAQNNIQLTGLLDINFEGDSIDNFIGYAKFYNGKMKGNAALVKFDSLSLVSGIKDGIKNISIASDDIQANIRGKFNIQHLPASIQYFMQRYLPTYIPAPKNTPANQEFTIDVKTNYFEPYIRLFNADISGFNNINLKGALNTNKQNINLTANIPYASWKYNWADYAIRSGNIQGNGNIDSLHLGITAKEFHLTDSFSFDKPSLQIHSSKDISTVNFFATSHSALEQISLQGKVHTFNDGISINWLPTYFLLNQKKWTIENGGEIILRESNTSASNFKCTQGLQELFISNSNKSKNGLQISLKDVILGDITKVFFNNPSLEGITNGSIQLKNILSDFSLEAALRINQFAYNTDSIGNLSLNASYIHSKGIVPFSFEAPNTEYNLAATGTYNIKDSANPLDATLTLKHSKFSMVQQFIGNVVNHLEGKANGWIHFGGRIQNPYLLGQASLEDASLVVDYTKVKYFIENGSSIKFTNEGIDFGTIQLSDLQNRKASFKGKIINQGFAHLDYDLEMNSSKIELLNTDVFDNPDFYGKAVGKATLTIKGPEENIKMAINADVNDSSHIYLPNTSSKESGKSEFIVFKKYGKTAIKSADAPTFNLVVDLEVTANNKTQIDVILDELSGDVIKAVGNGRIKIRAGNLEPLTIRGKYNIESGKYDFNFQSFIKKPFELIPEAGNYIEWTGNPDQAEVHIDARYTANRVSLNELVGASNFSTAVKSYRGSVYVNAALRNKLAQPDIKFSLAFPQGNPISSDNEFSQFISRLERDDNEILKQVSFLIVFNSFAPVGFNNSNNNNAYTVTAIGINTISQLLTKEINKSIGNFITKATGDKSLRFDIGSSVYNSGNLLDPTGGGIAINANRIDRQRVNLKLGRSFLNDNIIVNIGGDVDFNVRNTSTIQNSDLQWLPDVNIEFILSRDRKLRAIVFNRNSLDINGSTLGKRNRQGASISYRRDFD